MRRFILNGALADTSKSEITWGALLSNHIHHVFPTLYLVSAIVVPAAFQMFFPILTAVRARNRGEYGSGLFAGRSCCLCCFPELLFDGDIAMLMSETVGFTFFQQTALRYRHGRVKMRRNELTDIMKHSKPEDGTTDEWNAKVYGPVDSKLDIVAALCRKMIIRFGLVILWNNALFYFQIAGFMVRKYIVMGPYKRLVMAAALGISAFTALHPTTDDFHLATIVDDVGKDCERVQWEGPSCNGNSRVGLKADLIVGCVFCACIWMFTLVVIVQFLGIYVVCDG